MTFSKVNHQSALHIISYTVFGLLLMGFIALHIFATKAAPGAYFFYAFFLLVWLMMVRPFSKINITELFIEEKGIFRKKTLNWSCIQQVSLVLRTRSNLYFISEKHADDGFLYSGISICLIKYRTLDPPNLFTPSQDYISFEFRPEVWELIRKILSQNQQSHVMTAAPIAKKG